jgi:hypothetical protein
MSNTALETPRKPAEPLRRSPAARVQGKLAVALALMVDEGCPMSEAAQQAGMTTHAVREAFAKPHVLEYVRKRRQMLLASVNTRNIQRLAEIRDAADNMPAVNSVLALERMAGDATSTPGGSLSHSPGVTIVINSGQSDERQPVKTTIDLTANPPILDDSA